MFTIYKWTIWQRRWSIFWWSVGVVALVVITLVFYPAFKDQADLNKQLENLPQAAKSLISDTGDFFSPQGYLSSQLYYLTLPLILSILSMGLGSSLIAKEEDGGTIELLLSRPVSRGKVLLGKAAAGVVILIIVSVLALISAVVMCKLVSIDVSLAGVVMATFMALVLALLFGAVAFMVTTIGRARIASIGIAVLIAFGGYIVSSLAEVVGWLKWPARFLPYHYYQPGAALNGNYYWRNVIFLLIVTVILGFISWSAFRRRDLNG